MTAVARTGSAAKEHRDAVSRDRFFRGGFEALQPLGHGHRSGSDALLLAAALPQDASGALADLGAGAGVAAFAALAANPRLAATLVEIDPATASLASRALELPANAHLRGRAKIVVADVTLTGARRRKAGLIDNAFDHAIANPPYNHPAQRASPDPVKRLAHRMEEGGIAAWVRSAAAILKPGGLFFVIWRTEKLGELIAAAASRFGALTILPLHAKAGEPASRIVVRAQKGSKAPLVLLSGMVLHDDHGRQNDTADALLNGRARLPFPQGNSGRKAAGAKPLQTSPGRSI